MADPNDTNTSAPVARFGDQTQVAPRGTDRVRRREAQAQHAEQAVQEAATLIPPRGEEKVRKIAENKAAEDKRNAGQSPTKARQAANRAEALEQDRAFAGVEVLQRAALVPGQQVDARTARLVAKASDREERDFIRDAAKAAGFAVHETLKGRPSQNTRTVHAKIAQHNARNAAARAAKG